MKLRRADTGAVIVVEITKLSEADREFCKEALERVEKDAAMKAIEDAFSPGLDAIAESHKSEHETIKSINAADLTTILKKAEVSAAKKRSKEQIAGQKINLHGIIQDVSEPNITFLHGYPGRGVKYLILHFEIPMLRIVSKRNTVTIPGRKIEVPVLAGTADWLSVRKGTAARIVGVANKPVPGHHSSVSASLLIDHPEAKSVINTNVTVYVLGIHILTEEEIAVWETLKMRNAIR